MWLRKLNEILEKYIHISLESPLKTWRKAKKYFVKPKKHIRFFFTYEINFVDDETISKWDLKVHKLFGKKFYIYRNYYAPYACTNYVGRIVDFNSKDVMWKGKWNSPRHERDPFIYFCLFRLFGFCITYKIDYVDAECRKRDGGMYYWEYLLNYLYYTKSLKVVDCWQYDSKVYRVHNYKEDKYEPYKLVVDFPRFSLNKRGRKEFINLTKNE